MDKYLDKQGLVIYSQKLKEYIDSKVPSAASSIADGETGYTTGDQVYDALQNIDVPSAATAIADGVQSLSDNDLTEAFLGYHYDWYKENDDFVNVITPISVNGINYKVYITETSLEDDTTRIIRFAGAAYKETDAETGDFRIAIDPNASIDYITRDALGNDTVVSSITNDGNWVVCFGGATEEETLTDMYGTYQIDVQYNYPDIELSTELEVESV